MTDIVDRLLWATSDPVTGEPYSPSTHRLMTIGDLRAAADEIKRLRSLVQRQTPTVSTTGAFAPSPRGKVGE